MQSYRTLAMLRISFLLLMSTLLAACGTFEMHVEMPGDVRRADMVTMEIVSTAERIPPQLPEMTPTPAPADYDPWPTQPASSVPTADYVAPAGLRVAFAKNDQIWLWSADDGRVVPLASTSGSSGDVRISDDGTIVAFLRWREPTCLDCSQQELDLWVVNSDGMEERQLVSAEDLDTMQPGDARAAVHQLEWMPNTHILAFNTSQAMAFGLVLNDDLHLVDADSSEWTTMLPRGEGGEFHFSPDGDRIAVVKPGDISLVKVGEGNPKSQVLTYTPVNNLWC